jgi:hypothetical protein
MASAVSTRSPPNCNADSTDATPHFGLPPCGRPGQGGEVLDKRVFRLPLCRIRANSRLDAVFVRTTSAWGESRATYQGPPRVTFTNEPPSYR